MDNTKSKKRSSQLESKDVGEFHYFQFFTKNEINIYLQIDLQQLTPSLVSLLKELNFTEVTVKGGMHELQQKDNCRILKINDASSQVVKNIIAITETDRYGLESLNQKLGYQVYRYKGVGLMVMSNRSQVWELGVMPNFGSKEDRLASACVLTRFLTWALDQLGYVGFWGVTVDNGVVIMKPKQCNYEAVFINPKERTILSREGKKAIKGQLSIIRLDEHVQNEPIGMSNEELISFLSYHTTYFDMNGLSFSARQSIFNLVSLSKGLIYPKDSFKSRTDLSL